MSKQPVRLSKWTPSYPTPPKDGIISSQSRANNEKGFLPTYENEGRPNMYCLLNEEYRRMWFKERAVYEKEVYTKKAMMKEESKIKRRFVQRCLVPKKQGKVMPQIHLKRFRDVPAKIEDHAKKKDTAPTDRNQQEVEKQQVNQQEASHHETEHHEVVQHEAENQESGHHDSESHQVEHHDANSHGDQK